MALEGGGVRGSYQIGAFMALHDSNIQIDGFVGTSIGSFNAAILATGHYKELLEFWQTVDVSKLLAIKPLNLKMLELKNISDTVKSYLKLLKNKGINVDSLLQVVDELLDVEALYKSNKDFGLVTFRLKDLKPIYKYKEDIPKSKIKDYILASCYLPVFKMEKIIDDNYYIDGGVYDNSPINLLINKGYNKVYVVKLNSIGITRKLTKEVDLTIIKPSRNLGSILGFDQNKIKDNIKMGYYDTIRILKNFDGYKYLFTAKSKNYYKFLGRKVNSRLLKRIYAFFNVDNMHDAVIKSLEFIMEKEKYDYYKIYKPYKIIKRIKKKTNKKNFIYDFIKLLKFI